MSEIVQILTYNIIFCLIMLGACAATPKPAKKSTASYTIAGQRYYVLDSAHGFTQQGLASWYGEDFQGRPTASGETYDMYAKTAAHKTLPLGTQLLVSNLDNGRSAIVRVNDRGPFVRGRIIDLSYMAANELGMLENGVAPVKIEALALNSSNNRDFKRGNFTVQLGAFRDKNNAQGLANRLKNSHIALYDNPSGVFYRVRIGRFSSLDEAQKACQELEAAGFAEAFVVAE
jgi:rare lipoprotein A